MRRIIESNCLWSSIISICSPTSNWRFAPTRCWGEDTPPVNNTSTTSGTDTKYPITTLPASCGCDALNPQQINRQCYPLSTETESRGALFRDKYRYHSSVSRQSSTHKINYRVK